MFRIFRFILTLLSIVAATNVFAAGNVVLSGQAFSFIDTDGHLVIEFQKPMGYISHSPPKSGKTLVVKLKDLFPTAESNNVNERLVVPSQQQAPISEIIYEQNGTVNGILTIQFTRNIDYTIQFSRDRKSLSLVLKDIRAPQEDVIRPADTGTALSIYEINLQSSTTPIDTTNQPMLVNFTAFDIYTDLQQSGNKPLYTLHLGYFYSKSLATANLERLKQFYPAAWVSEVSAERHATAETWFFNTRIASLRKQQPEKAPSKSDELLDRAKQAMVNKDYPAAIRYLTRIQEIGDPNYQQLTRELLGLARERNGQFAHAKAEYEEYLRLYPDGEDAERVKQRLFGMITARSKLKEKLEEAPQAHEPAWEFYGSLFQFYNRQSVVVDESPVTVTDSSIRTDLIYTGRKRGTEFDQRFNIAADNRYDLEADTDNSENEVSSLYYDATKRDGNYGFRIGRQSHSSDGVLGRFDGVIVNKAIGTDMKLNFLAGYPVELSIDNNVNTDRQFYGISYDFNALFTNTDLKFYYLSQTNSGLTDRTAVGTELKSVNEFSSYFFLLDYDTFYSELNIATFVGTWRNEANSTLNFIADYRMSPALTTNNALIGQPVTTMEELKLLYSDDEIYQLARDRTAQYKSISLSASTLLGKDYQLNGDITYSNLGETVASGGVPASVATGNDLFYNLSLVATNFFTDNDLTIFGLRYSDTDFYQTTQVNFSSNFNFSRDLRINPRLVYEVRDSTVNSSTRTVWLPRLVANYRVTRNFKLELDTGYRTADTTATTTTTASTEEDFYFYFGYIYDF